MILLAHPFGNANVRAVLAALNDAGMLAKFITAVGWPDAAIPEKVPLKIRSTLSRRSYKLSRKKIKTLPGREIIRLLAQKTGQQWLITHEQGWASIDRVWQKLDEFAADFLASSPRSEEIKAVYAYEDCAERLFEKAREIEVHRIYDLPIAYWQTSRRLLDEEGERYPQWEPTLGGTRDSEEKLARKTRELDLAELVICPSTFVFESLPQMAKATKTCLVIPFGSPSGQVEPAKDRGKNRPLRILFAGALTQRKGLADVFEAMKLIASKEVELVVMGALSCPLSWYREQFPPFTYEPPRPHREVLQLMQTCDVLVLPSIVEGRALVQQEAMACGLPLIVTRNAGAEDLISEGETGFLVPIRAPGAIAEKIDWFASNRERIAGMAIAAQHRARERTWDDYGAEVLQAILSVGGK